MVYLREARRELARAGAGRRHDDDRLLGLHVVVLAVADVGDDGVYVGRVACGLVVVVDPDAAALELRAELLHGRLLLEARDDDAAHEKPERAEVVYELERVVGVRYAEVGAHLLAVDVARVEAEDDLGLVLQGLEKPQLHVRVVAWETPRRMEVVYKLPAELEVEPPVLPGAAADLLGLLLKVLLVVETDLHRPSSLSMASIFGMHFPQPPPALVKFVTSSTVVSWFSVMTRRISFSETL